MVFRVARRCRATLIFSKPTHAKTYIVCARSRKDPTHAISADSTASHSDNQDASDNLLPVKKKAGQKPGSPQKTNLLVDTCGRHFLRNLFH